MSTQPIPRHAPAEYLELEREAERKSEFLDGVIYAIAGATPRHVLIVGNIARELGNQLRDRPCAVYSTDLRVCAASGDLYAYPDVAVICGEPTFLDDRFDTLTNPLLIVEVLSDSTKNYDRGEKFERYRLNPSFREYLLVAQDKVHVERHIRQDDGAWVMRETNNPADTIELASISCRLPVAEIYLKIEF